LLDIVSVRVNLKDTTMPYVAEIPCLDESKIGITEKVVSENQALLGSGIWGAVKIIHDPSEESKGIRIIEFKPMQTGRISLDVFMECRKEFTENEWIDLIITTMGYEPNKYSEIEKIWLICRLIPIVQNRVNMMELAPPNSGKSYIYNNISRYVWLTAGEISPAKLFYNLSTKQTGLLTKYDLLVLDEAHSISFTSSGEVQAQLKGYLEQGVYARGDLKATAECGLMLLANIELEADASKKYGSGKIGKKPLKNDYIRKLSSVFLDYALIDRFHGIIPGWEIPQFEEGFEADGIGLKTDFFAEVCHALRDVSSTSQRVRSKLALLGYKRDCTAIIRLCSALSKILLIDPDHPRFDDLVLSPAKEMRRLVRTQLHELNPHEFSVELDISQFKETTPFKMKINGYGIVEEIGKGGMAKVFKAIDTQNENIVAIKTTSERGAFPEKKSIQREIDIYMRLQNIINDHIIRVFDIFRHEDAYAIVMEFADGGSLWDLLGGDLEEGAKRDILDERTVKSITMSLIDGITALHDNEIVHRDIKPHNILRCDDLWKIADFGISKRINKPVTGYTFQGAHTAPWAAPEQIAGVEAHTSADIFSLGRVIAFLLTGQEKNNTDLSPKNWRDIIKKCIDYDPDNRPSIKKLHEQVEQLSI